MIAFRSNTKRGSRIAAALAALAIGAATVVLYSACVANPDIDGSKVPTIGSDAAPPPCSAVCSRLAALCGYAPVECESRCEADLGPEQRACIGLAPSCRSALQECPPPEEEDGGEEEETDGGEEEGDGEAEVDAGEDTPDASDDAPTADGDVDAAADAGDAATDA